jgi:hypothetical protein
MNKDKYEYFNIFDFIEENYLYLTLNKESTKMDNFLGWDELDFLIKELETDDNEPTIYQYYIENFVKLQKINMLLWVSGYYHHIQSILSVSFLKYFLIENNKFDVDLNFLISKNKRKRKRGEIFKDIEDEEDEISMRKIKKAKTFKFKSEITEEDYNINNIMTNLITILPFETIKDDMNYIFIKYRDIYDVIMNLINNDIYSIYKCTSIIYRLNKFKTNAIEIDDIDDIDENILLNNINEKRKKDIINLSSEILNINDKNKTDDLLNEFEFKSVISQVELYKNILNKNIIKESNFLLDYNNYYNEKILLYNTLYSLNQVVKDKKINNNLNDSKKKCLSLIKQKISENNFIKKENKDSLINLFTLMVDNNVLWVTRISNKNKKRFLTIEKFNEILSEYYYFISDEFIPTNLESIFDIVYNTFDNNLSYISTDYILIEIKETELVNIKKNFIYRFNNIFEKTDINEIFVQIKDLFQDINNYLDVVNI